MGSAPTRSSSGRDTSGRAPAPAGLTRRAFLGAAALGIGATTTPASATATVPERSRGAGTRPASVDPFEVPGQPSRAAHRALAAVEQRAQRTPAPAFERAVDAVEYLDLGSGTTLDAALARAAAAGELDGTRLDFPPGTYRIAGGFSISPAGAFGIVAPRATFRLDAGLRPELRFHGLSYGLFAGLTIDQRARNAAASVVVESEGHADVGGLTYRGPVEALDAESGGALLRPIAATPAASVRIDGLHAVGGTNAGSHAWAGSGPPPAGHVVGGVPGVFVGNSSTGTVQLVDATLRGWENGCYVARTDGAVQVIGGRFVNNNNTAVRISGERSFCDGATIVLDATRWPEDRPGEFRIGEIQGVSAVRSETGGLNKAGARLRNLDVRAYTMERSPGLLVYRGSAGRGRIERCRLRNDLDGAPAIRVDPPGSGPYSSYSGEQGVSMERIEVAGSMGGAPAVLGSEARSGSVLRDSCIRIPDAGPAAVENVATENVGYGDCTASQLLDGPVGRPGAIPGIRNRTVKPPVDPGSFGDTADGFALVLALGASVATAMGLGMPRLLERLGLG
jgi:hypothetical protein